MPLTLHEDHDNLDVLDELIYMLKHPIPKWTKDEVKQNQIAYIDYLKTIKSYIATRYTADTSRYLLVVMTSYMDPSKIIVRGYHINQSRFDQMMAHVNTFMKNLDVNGFVVEVNRNMLKQLYEIEAIVNENSLMTDRVLNMMNQPQYRRELTTVDLNVMQQAYLQSLIPLLYQQIASSMPKFEKEFRTLLTFCLVSSKYPILMHTHQ